ncbi:DUF4352 domain-containing protein [Spirillospora sp. NPDC029432]|uniref:DUF4352 domain-containing protein n=1 Tax=Spirillospora sp. NPDC029432 TaxID=3154599 RepID=UPI0034557B69
MRRSPAALALALCLAALTPACSGGGDGEGRPAAYEIPAERARDGERVLRGRTGRSSDLEFTVLGYRDGMREILGTHAGMRPKGRYVRVRLLVVNRGRDIQVFDTWKQLLHTGDGRTHTPDVNATMVKRQPERLSVGAAMRAEFDLWYDLPGEAAVRGLRLVGSPTVGAVSDPRPAEIRLP